MDVQHVEIDRDKARELYREYKKAAHYSKPLDREIQRGYQLLAQGRLIIRALESVKSAGVKLEGADAGFPKLALCRADAFSCSIEIEPSGAGVMHASDTTPRSRRRWGGTLDVYQSRSVFTFPAGSFVAPDKHRRWRGQALVPTPPLNLRPKRGLASYHVLWEAEWTKIVPHDPMLLRRLGISDMWVVVAMWELTAIEKVALATRITA